MATPRGQLCNKTLFLLIWLQKCLSSGYKIDLPKTYLSLQRKRRLNDEAINRRIKGSERNRVIVVDRVGGSIVPSVSLDHREEINRGNISNDDGSYYCIFFSVLVILLLILLFVCFYRFLYTKLRCICRRFDYSEDRKRCLSEQSYGTASSSDSSSKKMPKTCSFYHSAANRSFTESTNYESSDKSSSTNETNDEMFDSRIDEKRGLLLSPTNDSTKKKRSSAEDCLSNFKQAECFELLNIRQKVNCSEIFEKRSGPDFLRSKARFFGHRKPFDCLSEKMLNLEKSERRKFNDTNFAKSEIHLTHSLSDAQLSFSTSTSPGGADKLKMSSSSNQSQKRDHEEQSPKWTSCSCNEMPDSRREMYSSTIEETKNSKEQEKCSKDQSIFRHSHGDVNSELSETYNELGMLFSEEMKRQWRPCRRRHCRLSKNLRKGGKTPEHDERKCKTRLRLNFGYRIVSTDERPACSSSEICRDTYDEFQLMRTTRKERESVARSIVERRKRFLDQPCLSPIPTEFLSR